MVILLAVVNMLVILVVTIMKCQLRFELHFGGSAPQLLKGQVALTRPLTYWAEW